MKLKIAVAFGSCVNIWACPKSNELFADTNHAPSGRYAIAGSSSSTVTFLCACADTLVLQHISDMTRKTRRAGTARGIAMTLIAKAKGGKEERALRRRRTHLQRLFAQSSWEYESHRPPYSCFPSVTRLGKERATRRHLLAGEVGVGCHEAPMLLDWV